MAIELTAMQREALRSVLRNHVGSIGAVGVYGSRAQGRSRPGSDVDLVVYGEIDERTLARINRDIDESDLSISWNLTAYAQVGNIKLKEQIDHWVQPLFTRQELLAA